MSRPTGASIATFPPGVSAVRGAWIPLGCLLLAMVALFVLVPPGGEFATDDDWDYALTVQRLVETGRLQLSAWAQATLVFQIAWGGLFARLFGFSHTILRVSTLVLAALGVVSFYGLARQFF